MSKGDKAHKLKNDPTSFYFRVLPSHQENLAHSSPVVKPEEVRRQGSRKTDTLTKRQIDSQNSRIQVATKEKARVHIRITISTQNIDKATNKNYFSQGVLYFKMLVMIKEEGSGTEMATGKCSLL